MSRPVPEDRYYALVTGANGYDFSYRLPDGQFLHWPFPLLIYLFALQGSRSCNMLSPDRRVSRDSTVHPIDNSDIHNQKSPKGSRYGVADTQAH